MLISHRHRFIFVKTRKSAGTSVEISLARFCDGPEDVITPISREDRSLQREAGVSPKNHRKEGLGIAFGPHVRAARIRRLVGREVWDGYTSFCFVRNPWERMVSQFAFRRSRRPRMASPTFDAFVRDERFTVEWGMYASKDQVLVDHVLRYEDLQAELGRITELLGLEWDGWLPQAERLASRDWHYSHAYTEELVEIVARRCAKEIEQHGYRFEGRPRVAGEPFAGWPEAVRPPAHFTRRSLFGLRP